MYYRLATREDYIRISYVHRQAFSDFFLTSLGISFLKTYYNTSLGSKDCIAVCACNDESEIVGFALGTVLSKGHHKRLLLGNIFPFMVRAFVILITRPIALVRLSQNLKKSAVASDDGQYAELLSIGVLKSVKGSGVGKQLLEIFEKELAARGSKEVVLTTDFFNNDDVIKFYKKQGYKIFYEFITYPERKMYKMIKTL